jgi:5-carboxymethyl-2-hydroxymuconate isomerase/acylpyruvate hydrolase
MRLITFKRHTNATPEIGARIRTDQQDQVLPFADMAARQQISNFPATMRTFLQQGDQVMATAKAWAAKPEPSVLIPTKDIIYLPPIGDAEKFLCVGKNYRKHLAELERNNLIKEIPEEPTGFIKLNSCLAGHQQTVIKPKGIDRLDYEPELVFVMGKRALGASKEEAFSYVAGVTILNDLTDRDLQQREVKSGSRFWTAKNIPGFGPLGPEIITMDEITNPYDLWMICRVNGEERMRVNTEEQIWKFPDILHHFSRFIPIEPGDMFSTGAPGGVAVGKPNAEDYFLRDGDVVECEIEGISTLSTTIKEETQ